MIVTLAGASARVCECSDAVSTTGRSSNNTDELFFSPLLLWARTSTGRNSRPAVNTARRHGFGRMGLLWAASNRTSVAPHRLCLISAAMAGAFRNSRSLNSQPVQPMSSTEQPMAETAARTQPPLALRRLPPFPAIAHRILALANRDDVNVRIQIGRAHV